MTDSKLRELERRWRESGSAKDQRALVAERVRVGELPPEASATYGYVHGWSGASSTVEEMVDAAWSCIEAWFAREAPLALANLSPPADPEAVAALEQQLEIELPPGVRASWARHDGQVASTPQVYDCYWELLSVARAIDEWDMLSGLFDEEDTADYWGENPELTGHPESVLPVVWSHRWLPVFSAGSSVICVDFKPATAGVLGQVFSRTHTCDYRMLATSFEDLLSRYALSLLENDYVANQDGDLFTNDEQGRQWMADMAVTKEKVRRNALRRERRKKTKSKKTKPKKTKPKKAKAKKTKSKKTRAKKTKAKKKR